MLAISSSLSPQSTPRRSYAPWAPGEQTIKGTTPVPNALFDVVMPNLSDTELRLLLVVVRSTLGWQVGEGEKGKRKTHDRLSHRQLQQRTGRAGAAVSKAIDALVQRGLLIVQDEKGRELATTIQRRARRGKLFYCLGFYQQGEVAGSFAPASNETTSGAETLKSEVDTRESQLLSDQQKGGRAMGSEPTGNRPSGPSNTGQNNSRIDLSTSKSGLHKAKTTKESETKETHVGREQTPEIRIDLSSLQSEVITIGQEALDQLKPPAATSLPVISPPVIASPTLSMSPDFVPSHSIPLGKLSASRIDEVAPRVTAKVEISQPSVPEAQSQPSEARDSALISGQNAEQESFLKFFATTYQEARPNQPMPEVQEVDLQRLESYLEKQGSALLRQWLPAFFACQFGYVRRREWSLAAYLETIFVLQAQRPQ